MSQNHFSVADIGCFRNWLTIFQGESSEPGGKTGKIGAMN